MTKTDLQLKEDIEAELRADTLVNSAEIGVCVHHGAVSLLGEVDSYPEKWAAEDAAERVVGVRTVARDISVRTPMAHAPSDSELAASIQCALTWDVFVPRTVVARVQKGWVTLEGDVAWNYQRDAAERAVRLPGVQAVSNSIRLRPQIAPTPPKEKVWFFADVVELVD
jgi:osmotically-inducible protein OsmY